MYIPKTAAIYGVNTSCCKCKYWCLLKLCCCIALHNSRVIHDAVLGDLTVWDYTLFRHIIMIYYYYWPIIIINIIIIRVPLLSFSTYSCLFLIARLIAAHCGGTFDRGRRVCWLCCHRYRELLGSRQDATEAKCSRSAGHCREENFHPHTFHLD